MTSVAQAFVPGHVTGFFRSCPDPDPTKAGSQGAGIAISDGVTVTVRAPTDSSQSGNSVELDGNTDSGVELNGDPVEMDAVDRVLRTLQVEAEVRAVTDLPLGAGFGVSGAMALGTALATNAAFSRRLSMNELVTIAHGAEVEAGTGLGDVVAQANGGVTIRLEPGGPQYYKLDSILARERVEYLTMGGLSTSAVLDDNTDAIDEAGKVALSEVVTEPTIGTFMHASRQFSRESELLTAEAREVIRDVTEADGTAAMAMLGNTVFAIGSGLSDAGYDASVCKIHHAGAGLSA